MAGKFINTIQTNTINSVTDGFKEKLNNPYYPWTDKKPFIVDYYNINKDQSTADESLGYIYANLGPLTPLRFDKITDFYLYGLERLVAQIEMGEFGLESAQMLQSEAIILPNTIVPIAGDHFKIKYLDTDYIFRVSKVDIDTIQSGGNIHRIEFYFFDTNDSNIQSKVIRNFNFMIDNTGTEFNPIILNTDYNYIESIEELNRQLRGYYYQLFFNTRVQSFCFGTLHDPYLTEFIIRNRLMADKSEYRFITQQLKLMATFGIEYDKTFFRKLEIGEFGAYAVVKNTCYAEGIEQPLSIFKTRNEPYYEVKYITPQEAPLYENVGLQIFNPFEWSLFDDISLATLKDNINDILVKYFNKIPLSSNDIELITNTDYNQTRELYYKIPCIIYVLDRIIIDLMKRKVKVN